MHAEIFVKRRRGEPAISIVLAVPAPEPEHAEARDAVAIGVRRLGGSGLTGCRRSEPIGLPGWCADRGAAARKERCNLASKIRSRGLSRARDSV